MPIITAQSQSRTDTGIRHRAGKQGSCKWVGKPFPPEARTMRKRPKKVLLASTEVGCGCHDTQRHAASRGENSGLTNHWRRRQTGDYTQEVTLQGEWIAACRANVREEAAAGESLPTPGSVHGRHPSPAADTHSLSRLTTRCVPHVSHRGSIRETKVRARAAKVLLTIRVAGPGCPAGGRGRDMASGVATDPSTCQAA